MYKGVRDGEITAFVGDGEITTFLRHEGVYQEHTC